MSLNHITSNITKVMDSLYDTVTSFHNKNTELLEEIESLSKHNSNLFNKITQLNAERMILATAMVECTVSSCDVCLVKCIWTDFLRDAKSYMVEYSTPLRTREEVIQAVLDWATKQANWGYPIKEIKND